MDDESQGEGILDNQAPNPKRVFGEADQLILEEARERFDFEQKSAVALHSKSTLFLTLTSVFIALIAAAIWRLLDRAPSSLLEIIALCIFVLTLGLLTVAAILLGRTALSQSYQVIATPAHWARYLAVMRD